MVIKYIAAYIHEKGIQQSKLAKYLNIKPQTMGQILAGKRRLTADEYSAICEFLEVPYERFFVEEATKNREFLVPSNSTSVVDIRQPH